MKFSGIGETILTKCGTSVNYHCAMWVLCITTACCPMSLQAQDAAPKTSHARPRTTSTSPAPNDKATESAHRGKPLATKIQSPGSSSDVAPRPATVILENGILTVTANNSDLSQILRDVAKVSGMTIDGSIRSPRVYGVYGPRNPREVLTDLLEGSGYNFMMVGLTHEGTPRQLLLTRQSDASLPVSNPAPTSAASNPTSNSDVNKPDQEPVGPGAVVNVPPAPSEDPNERMQQNLQRLQQMQDQMKRPDPPQ